MGLQLSLAHDEGAIAQKAPKVEATTFGEAEAEAVQDDVGMVHVLLVYIYFQVQGCESPS